MFSSKGFFSETICPFLSECHIPHCIFSHPQPNDASGHVADPDKSSVENEDVNAQRKRRKLDDDPEALKFGLLSKTNSISDTTPLSPDKDTRKNQPDLSARISPPPLRRKPINQIPSTFKQSPKIEAPSTQPNGKPDALVPMDIPIKKEGLNPRHLKGSAPASHDMRLRLVRALHEQLARLNSELAKDATQGEQRLLLSEQALITKALDVEEEACGSPLIYSNIVKNKILFFKRMPMKDWIVERQRALELAEHAKAIRPATTMNEAISKELPKSLGTNLNDDDELKLLERLYTPIIGLSQHGYATSIPKEVDIEKATLGVEAAQGWEVCDRCKTRFQVFTGRREEDGALTSGGCCTYHYGKPYLQERSATDPKAKRTKRYRCCGEAIGDSAGCTQSENHVFKISEVKRLAAVFNFVKTPENLAMDSHYPLCIDGEMGYTVYGLELIRLTATAWSTGVTIFDVLVKPLGAILDLNSRFSGVWPKDMAEALPWSSRIFHGSDGNERLGIVASPQAARDLLFSHISPRTPLIGHGLENDLNACRIIHPVLIDTALLYPHTAGLPYRNGLKALMQTHLNRQIQVVVDGKMQGHDSKEDANAAGELVKLALKKEWDHLKREGWEVHGGEFMHPTSKEPLFGDGSKAPSAREVEGRTKNSAPTGPRKRAWDEPNARGNFGRGNRGGHTRRHSRDEDAGRRSSSPAVPPRRRSHQPPAEEVELQY